MKTIKIYRNNYEFQVCKEYPLLRFKGGSPVKPPPPPPPPPVPDEAPESKEFARRKRPRGFRETFLTGALIPETEKKKELGF